MENSLKHLYVVSIFLSYVLSFKWNVWNVKQTERKENIAEGGGGTLKYECTPSPI